MATTARRCVGSERFGIEPHEAPIEDFPKQPSRKDGLGRLCREHWKAYTSGLRKDAQARDAGEGGPSATEAATKHTATRRSDAKGTKTAARTGAGKKPSPKADEIDRAEALIADVDALPADEAVRRVGDDDVQRALETSAAGRGSPEPAA